MDRPLRRTTLRDQIKDRLVQRILDGTYGPGDRIVEIQVAAEFVAAQPDGPQRTLARHHRRPDGTCGGCLTGYNPWPCTAAIIAGIAARLTPRPAGPRR